MKLRSFSALDALLVGAVLLALIAGSLSLFDNPMGGPLQLALIMVGCSAALIGMKNGIGWAELEREIVATNAKTIGSIFIFLSIGVLIGAFILAGTVPTLLYAGLSLLSPGFFYPLACLICAIVSICIGSSWTTVATIGVGLMGTAYGFGLSPEITAGAVVAGAYFGDKMSPLSEPTNLAPAVCRPVQPYPPHGLGLGTELAARPVPVRLSRLERRSARRRTVQCAGAAGAAA